MLRSEFLSAPSETALRRMWQKPIDDKSTLVQVMAWYRQAASHYLSQCWPRSMSLYGIIKAKWLKLSLFWTNPTQQYIQNI